MSPTTDAARGRAVIEGCGLERDLLEYVLTAGACWRAARSQPAEAERWENLARAYSERASVLLAHDLPGWRWAETMEPGR